MKDPASGDTSPIDPFASAKANLRDTVKWLATTFAALAAVVLAGTSLTGIAHLSGVFLAISLTGGGLGLVCVICGAGLLVRLLTSESFFVTDLSLGRYGNLKEFLDRHATDILPPELSSIDAFLTLRVQAIQQVRQYAANPKSPEFVSANQFLSDIVVPLSRLTNLAQFEALRANLKATEPKLFALALGALFGLGVFAVFNGSASSAKTTSETEGPVVAFDPGINWSRWADSFSAKCGKGTPLKAQLLTATQSDWPRVRLLAPESCAGLVIPIPASAIASLSSAAP